MPNTNLPAQHSTATTGALAKSLDDLERLGLNLALKAAALRGVADLTRGATQQHLAGVRNGDLAALFDVLADSIAQEDARFQAGISSVRNASEE